MLTVVTLWVKTPVGKVCASKIVLNQGLFVSPQAIIY